MRPYVYEDFYGGTEPEGGFQHVCGLMGYSPGPPHYDPPCPACAKMLRVGAPSPDGADGKDANG